MKTWQLLLAAVLFGLLCSIVILILASRPGTEAIQIQAVERAMLQFEIYGEVREPGIYSSDEKNLRVSDAVALAGGFTDQADQVNSRLTTRILDGDKIIIPTPSQAESTLTPAVRSNLPELIDLNHASLELLMTLPGIGEKKAQDIINHRTARGSFQDVADLLEIDGFGEKTIEQFYDLVMVGQNGN
jgi:competence protein ComEA